MPSLLPVPVSSNQLLKFRYIYHAHCSEVREQL